MSHTSGHGTRVSMILLSTSGMDLREPVILLPSGCKNMHDTLENTKNLLRTFAPYSNMADRSLQRVFQWIMGEEKYKLSLNISFFLSGTIAPIVGVLITVWGGVFQNQWEYYGLS